MTKLRAALFSAFASAALLIAPVTVSASDSQPQIQHVTVRSTILSKFWNDNIQMDASVLLPDDYYNEPTEQYPVLYWIPGFYGNGSIDVGDELQFQRPMRRLHRAFIVVFLDGMFRGIDTEFVDSPNAGPWESALVQELMPQIERQFRVAGTSEARFIGGHSSGGWAALWLQIHHPQLFAGEWSVSPDPVDFEDFVGPDLTRVPPQNFFSDHAGRAYKVDGHLLRDFVLLPFGAEQYFSFEAVFSPRGSNGGPMPLFDRTTGIIDPVVEQYWEEHYDIAALLKKNWKTLAPLLRGKLHVFVGADDTFGLDRSVRLLQATLKGLGSDAEFAYIAGADHWTVFYRGGDLTERILSEALTKVPVQAVKASK
jgi:S-formylglutathione hydrolase FrmB